MEGAEGGTILDISLVVTICFPSCVLFQVKSSRIVELNGGDFEQLCGHKMKPKSVREGSKSQFEVLQVSRERSSENVFLENDLSSSFSSIFVYRW